MTSIIIVGVLALYSCGAAWLFSTAAHAGVPATDVVVSGGDASDYFQLAHTLMAQHRFALSATSSPEFFRLPGYPLFLAVLFSLTPSIYIVPLVQAVITALSACLIYLLGRRHFSAAVGVAAAIAFVFDPTTALLSMTALTETLYVFLLLSTVYVLSMYPSRMITNAVAGALLGVSILVRPVGIYLIPAFLVLSLLQRRAMRTTVINASMLILIAGAMTIPWALRNHALAGHFALTSQSAYNILFYNIVEYESYRTGRSEDSIKQEIESRIGSNDPFALRSFMYADEELSLDKELLRDSMPQYALFHLVRTAPFFFGSSFESRTYLLSTIKVLPPRQSADIMHLASSGQIIGAVEALSRQPLGIMERIFWVFVFCSASGYACISLWKRRSDIIFVTFSVVLISSLAIITGPISETRYRVPAEPFLFFLAFAGMSLVMGKIKQWRRASLKSSRTVQDETVEEIPNPAR